METMRALDDLVTAGKVRYIGFSDAPAWKMSQALGNLFWCKPEIQHLAQKN